ncbi:MAG: hypothetical protein WA734_17250 [Candidatus Acidiferrales bacterium]
MPVRSCRVTISDMSGLAHSVQVSAATLYEAVALGLAAIRSSDWVDGIPEGLNAVTVEVRDAPVEHSVRLSDFLKWLDRSGGTPLEITTRNRARSILGRATTK